MPQEKLVYFYSDLLIKWLEDYDEFKLEDQKILSQNWKYSSRRLLKQLHDLSLSQTHVLFIHKTGFNFILKF